MYKYAVTYQNCFGKAPLLRTRSLFPALRRYLIAQAYRLVYEPDCVIRIERKQTKVIK